MQIITKYILKNYLIQLFLTIIICSIFFIITDLFELSKVIAENNVPFSIVCKYYYYSIPLFVFRYILPIANFLAIFICIGYLSSKNEIIAMMSCGISYFKIVKPILICSFVLSLISLVMGLYIIPTANQKGRYIKDIQIKQRTQNRQVFNNVQLKIKKETFLFIKSFDYKNKNFEDVQIFKRDNNINLKYELTAQKVEYKNNEWHFIDGSERNFENPKKYQYKEFDDYIYDIGAKPEEIYNALTINNKQAEEKTFSDLMKYKTILKTWSLPYVTTVVDIHYKFSFPFAIFILAIVGLPIAVKSKKNNLSFGFGITLILSFIYWIIFQIGISLGYLNDLSPLTGAWLGNIIFIIFSIYLHYKFKI